MFTAEYLLESDWYRERLVAKQHRDVALWRRHLAYVDRFIVRHGRERSFGTWTCWPVISGQEAELARMRTGVSSRAVWHARRPWSRAEQDQAERDARTVGAM